MTAYKTVPAISSVFVEGIGEIVADPNTGLITLNSIAYAAVSAHGITLIPAEDIQEVQPSEVDEPTEEVVAPKVSRGRPKKAS